VPMAQEDIGRGRPGASILWELTGQNRTGILLRTAARWAEFFHNDRFTIITEITILRLLFPCVMPGRRRIWAEATRDAGAPIDSNLAPNGVCRAGCSAPLHALQPAGRLRDAGDRPRPERTSGKSDRPNMFHHKKNCEV
jgi:hypothetical protein